MSKVCNNCGSASLYTSDLMDDFQGILTCSKCKTKHYPEKPKVGTQDLYTVKDVQTVREYLLKEQEGFCAITGLKIEQGQAVLEHNHEGEIYVRGVASRASNSMLGVIENNFKRYMKHWYPDSISHFLRCCASYLEEKPDKRFRHNSWNAKVKTSFNKLTAKQMQHVLEHFGVPTGSNLVQRKKAFAKVVLDRAHGYDTIQSAISASKKVS